MALTDLRLQLLTVGQVLDTERLHILGGADLPRRKDLQQGLSGVIPRAIAHLKGRRHGRQSGLRFSDHGVVGLDVFAEDAGRGAFSALLPRCFSKTVSTISQRTSPSSSQGSKLSNFDNFSNSRVWTSL
jgi:hypothetical protein